MAEPNRDEPGETESLKVPGGALEDGPAVSFGSLSDAPPGRSVLTTLSLTGLDPEPAPPDAPKAAPAPAGTTWLDDETALFNGKSYAIEAMPFDRKAGIEALYTITRDVCVRRGPILTPG
jgi:hypothetical protein